MHHIDSSPFYESRDAGRIADLIADFALGMGMQPEMLQNLENWHSFLYCLESRAIQLEMH